MGLSRALLTINDKGIVNRSRCLNYGHCGRMGKAVMGTGKHGIDVFRRYERQFKIPPCVKVYTGAFLTFLDLILAVRIRWNVAGLFRS